jgi:RNA polymerase sigma-70 factor (ECF subfamily)
MVKAPPEKLTPELIFREYAPRIYNIARRMLGNDADAEDVMQEVLLLVIRKLDTFRGDSQIETWLHRVTVNAALALRQKRANRQKHEVGESNEELESSPPKASASNWGSSPEEPVLAAEQHAIIEKAIRTLPEPFRDVFVLADVEGLPNTEIADMLSMSVPAVKSRLHRARLRMRDALAPHFEGGMSS